MMMVTRRIVDVSLVNGPVVTLVLEIGPVAEPIVAATRGDLG